MACMPSTLISNTCLTWCSVGKWCSPCWPAETPTDVNKADKARSDRIILRYCIGILLGVVDTAELLPYSTYIAIIRVRQNSRLIPNNYYAISFFAPEPEMKAQD